MLSEGYRQQGDRWALEKEGVSLLKHFLKHFYVFVPVFLCVCATCVQELWRLKRVLDPQNWSWRRW